MAWSEAQLSALRALDPEDTYSGSKDRRINARTIKSLQRRGMVTPADNAQGATITDYGLRTIREYVNRTGNGPERLKAMFRF
jgi:hypothetical protein